MKVSFGLGLGLGLGIFAGMPAPADATKLDYDDFQTNLTFESPDAKPEAIIAFYKDRLGKQGWQARASRRARREGDQNVGGCRHGRVHGQSNTERKAKQALPCSHRSIARIGRLDYFILAA